MATTTCSPASKPGSPMRASRLLRRDGAHLAPPGQKGSQLFPRAGGCSGTHVRRAERKMGMRGSPTAQVRLDGVRIGADPAFGEEGQGFAIAIGRAARRSALASQPAPLGWPRRRWTRRSPTPGNARPSASPSAISKGSRSSSRIWPPGSQPRDRSTWTPPVPGRPADRTRPRRRWRSCSPRTCACV